MPIESPFVLLSIVVIQFLAFLSFYGRPFGRHAVYEAPYAWIIDALAIMSGTIIMWASAAALRSPWIFAVEQPRALLFLLFIFGSWQTCIHGAKWYVRALQN